MADALLPLYMGPHWQRFSKLADISLEVGGISLPAHLSTLAQHSPVILDMVEGSESTEGAPRGRIELAEPFRDKSQAGVLLLLRCCYQPQNVQRFLAEALTEDPSELPLHELFDLAHYFQAATLLGECEGHLSGDLADRLQPGSLERWVATAERCGCARLQQILIERVAQQLTEQHTPERLKELIANLSPDSAARIIAAAWDAFGTGGGAGGPPNGLPNGEALGGAFAMAELQEALTAAQAEAAAAQARAAAAEAAAGAAKGEPGGLGAVPAALGQWLPPGLSLVALEKESFVVEWSMPGFSTIGAQVLDSSGFGPGQAWRVRVFPRGADGKSEVVGLFLTFGGATAVQVKYTVMLVNQRDPSQSRSMGAVSTFVPNSQEGMWGSPQFITRPELLDAASGFAVEDTIRVQVSVAPPPA